MKSLNKNNIYYVYIWIRKDKGFDQVFYVGKGHNNRYKDMSERNKWFLNVVHKVGKENIEIKIIEKDLFEDEALEREKYWIAYYREQGEPLTNLTDGGEGSSNWYEFLTDEEKEKHKEISKSFLGKHHTEETKKKMSEAAKGKKKTKEATQKMSQTRKEKFKNGELVAPWKDKHLSEETKRKISEARKQKQYVPLHSKSVIVIQNNEIILEFKSLTTCGNFFKIDRHKIDKMINNNVSFQNTKNIEELNQYINCIFKYKQL